jgi:predicted peptidase
MEDPYILVIPTKREWNWNPQKVFDVLEDLKANMRVDKDRICSTGLSMGGRGAYIVGTELLHYFAALIPLSPHHEPYSYLPLASKIAHLPVWMSHGTADEVSSYEMAKELKKKGAYISFYPIEGGIHWGWEKNYSSPARINGF